MKSFMQKDPVSPRSDQQEFGSVDTKITSFAMSKDFSFIAISGPPKANQPFTWANSSTPHHGIPETFNFQWVTIKPEPYCLIHPWIIHFILKKFTRVSHNRHHKCAGTFSDVPTSVLISCFLFLSALISTIGSHKGIVYSPEWCISPSVFIKWLNGKSGE